MNNNIQAACDGVSPFNSIRRVEEDTEFWLARELMPILGYQKWERFGAKEGNQVSVVCRAIISCSNSGGVVLDNFIHFPKQGTGFSAIAEDWKLSRQACYLVAMNGDVTKSEIAAAQSYFAIKTLQAETTTTIEQVAPKREVKNVQICPAEKHLDLSGLTFGELKRLFYFRASIEDALGPLEGLTYDIDPTLWAADLTSISLASEKLCLDLEERCLARRKQELAETKRAIRLRKKDIANLQCGKVSRLFPDFGRHYEQSECDSILMMEVDS